MELVRRVHAMKETARQVRGRGLRVGLVPTMGALHEGHLSLVREARKFSEVVVLSIFVNPTQFNEHSDFEHYPRDLTRDADLCIAEGVDYIFAPEAPEMYPAGPGTWVEVADLSHRIEGASRPGHFRGVATVVLKLFNIVQPAVAAFGRKDAQQLAVIKRMVRDLMVDVEILECDTVREGDGLALSSRNVKLSPAERESARAIPRALAAAERAVADGESTADEVAAAARAVLEAEPGLRIDYVTLVDGKLQAAERLAGEGLLLVAAWAGETRLIDNVALRAAATGKKS
jgi:pantoate--beta-alanine ligase